jgi:hypothetical protein
MKITVFTSNQPRHVAYVSQLAAIADSVYVVMESNTVFPGRVKDFFGNSEVMQEYFTNVVASERRVFGGLAFTPPNVEVLALKAGDLNFLDRSDLEPALESDYYLVFGSSFIKGWLIDELVDNRAVNIHMGLSPYYRGSSCNFWAMYDGLPSFVGATAHMLSRGLDSGPILFHTRPHFSGQTAFDFTMEAVLTVQRRIVEEIEAGGLLTRESVAQDLDKEIRYSRNDEFTDSVAHEYLTRSHSPNEIAVLLQESLQPELRL